MTASQVTPEAVRVATNAAAKRNVVGGIEGNLSAKLIESLELMAYLQHNTINPIDFVMGIEVGLDLAKL